MDVSEHNISGTGDTFEVGEDVLTLVLGADGKPFEGVEEVEVVSVTPTLHTQFGLCDVRAYARCRVARTGDIVLKPWAMECGGAPCLRTTGKRCRKAALKRGVAGRLRRDAALALGRPLTPRERIPLWRTFVGKRFKASLRPVIEDANGTRLPEAARYTVVGEFLEVVGTSSFTLSESIGSGVTSSNSKSISEDDSGRGRAASGFSTDRLQNNEEAR